MAIPSKLVSIFVFCFLYKIIYIQFNSSLIALMDQFFWQGNNQSQRPAEATEMRKLTQSSDQNEEPSQRNYRRPSMTGGSCSCFCSIFCQWNSPQQIESSNGHLAKETIASIFKWVVIFVVAVVLIRVLVMDPFFDQSRELVNTALKSFNDTISSIKISFAGKNDRRKDPIEICFNVNKWLK